MTWAEWLIRALRETPTAPMVAQATWTARLLAATHDEAHNEPTETASALPAAVAATSPAAALRLSEFLVQHGAAHETHCLTQLVDALAARHDAHDLQELALDLTGRPIALGSDGTYPGTAALPPEAPTYGDHGSLCLIDGRSIAWSDVPAIAPDAASLIALRQSEAADSTLNGQVVVPAGGQLKVPTPRVG